MKALETLSGNGKVYISKDKEYDIQIESSGGCFVRYFLIDNFGDKIYLTKEEILVKFRRTKKEDIFV